MIINPQTDIMAIAFGISTISQIIRRKYSHPKQMKTKQEEMKTKQKKMKELMKKTDEKSKKELEKLEKEIMETSMEIMNKSMKTMTISMIIILPAFFLMAGAYETATINLPIPLPWFAENWNIQFYEQTSWIGWYLVSSITAGILIGTTIKIHEKYFKGEQ
jgi:uncharacterized membrane protein (DUF106 family)